jgi:hypothetical protein
MKLKFQIFFSILLLYPFQIQGQEPLIQIDSLYISSIDRFYKNAEVVKNEIWEGMELAPLCLFRINGPALLYNHPSPPESFTRVADRLFIGEQQELQLFGSTQAEINDVLTAIVDYGRAGYSGKEEVYAVAIHELHHVYQRNYIKQIQFDNPAVLLTYPENNLNDGLKLFEQETLYKMCFEQDRESFQMLLNQFYSCRLEREQIIGDYLKYEESVENLEGPAFFSEYQYYSKFSPVNKAVKKNYYEKHFFGPLTTPYYGRNSLRHRHLAAGMAMCFILDNNFDNWQSDYYSKELTLYDYFISRFKPQKKNLEIDSVYYQLSAFHTPQEVLGHQNSLNNFLSQPGIRITLNFNKSPQFKGFDPMNAESVNDSTILHKTILRLSGSGNNEIFITNKQAVTIIENKIWFVRKVHLFAPEEGIMLDNNQIQVRVEGKTVNWSGSLKKQNEKEIVFNCEY